MRTLTLLPLCLLMAFTCFAGTGPKKKPAGQNKEEDSIAAAGVAFLQFADSVNKALKYETGKVSLPSCNAALNIPAGFKFLNAAQSQFVLHDVWGNPSDPEVLGMIWPENNTPFTDTSYAFVISYDNIGYVKDNDAKSEDYGKMMTDLKAGQGKENEERTKEGYPTIEIIGWAEQPYYDDKQKVLHWARELKFANHDANTLNYEVRVLGRKGVLCLEAVGDMNELPLVNNDINAVLGMASFTPGNRYSDYNSGTDKVAEYTVGGLVAGAILTKVGFWAILLKFAKIIIAGIIAAFYGVRKWLTGRDRKRDEGSGVA